MSSFQIPEGPTQIAADGTTPAAFSVNNTTKDALRGRLSVQKADNAKAEWFALDGDTERMFPAGESQTVSVKINVPPGTTAGTYRFRLRVANVNDPDNDTAESPPVALTVATAVIPPPPKFPVWAIILIAVLLVAGVGTGLYFLLRPHDVINNQTGGGGNEQTPTQVVMPNLTDPAKPLDLGTAKQTLLALDPTLDIQTTTPDGTPDHPAGTVATQDPAAGQPIAKGATVHLGISTPWFFGTWTGTIDGRPATMRWWADTGHAITGDFSDGSTGVYVPLYYDSHTAQKLYFRHQDQTNWFLARTADGAASGTTTWQGRNYPLVMNRQSLTVQH
ncbi:hypothetical protein DMC47_31850 [Nostoc sp. 3335mG]|nr:hypothetical protein DMC47_31850 [Nostoc sp. 3335mG]